MDKLFCLLIVLSFTLSQTVFGLSASLEKKLNKYKIEKDVLELNQEQMNSSFVDFSYMMVQVYAYWSNESTAFLPEYIKAAKALRLHDPPIILGRIDAASNDVTNRIRLTSGLPYIRLIVNNKTIHDYQGDLESTNLINWAKRLTGEKSEKVNTVQQITEATEKHNLTIVYFGLEENDKELEQFGKVSIDYPDIIFLHTLNAEVREQFQIKKPSVIIFKTYDDKKVVYDGKVEYSMLKPFIDLNAYPLFLYPYQSKYNVKIFTKKTSALFLIADQSDKSKELLEIFQELSKSQKGRILFTAITDDDKNYKYIKEQFGLKQSDLPAIRIIGYQGDTNKYKLDNNKFNKEDIKKFITNFRIKRLQRYLISQDIPKDNETRNLKIVVSDTFEELVLNSKEDVLVVFTKGKCPTCESLEDQFEKIAKKVKSNTNLLFYKVDTENNELPWFQNKSNKEMPQVRFYPNGKKTKPVELDNDKSSKEYLNKLRDHVAYPWVLQAKVDL